MTTEPHPLKVKLYREAVADGTVALCWLVGWTLGKPQSLYPNRLSYHSPPLTFLVVSEPGGNYCVVWHRGVPVCCTRRGHWFFLPGPWVEHLRELAILARQVREREEARYDAVI